jgi:uncharacterized protein YggE
LTGYEVSQTILVKVRKTEDAGTILAKIGALKVENISGLDFVVDNIDVIEAQARDKAILDAKQKAEKLSKSLGINLSHIVNFYESGNTPIYAYAGVSLDAKMASPSVPPQIPTGENKIVSNVTITYEIR